MSADTRRRDIIASPSHCSAMENNPKAVQDARRLDVGESCRPLYADIGAGELGEHPSHHSTEKAVGDSQGARLTFGGAQPRGSETDEGTHCGRSSSIDNEALEGTPTPRSSSKTPAASVNEVRPRIIVMHGTATEANVGNLGFRMNREAAVRAFAKKEILHL